jgi:hypothetical protein
VADLLLTNNLAKILQKTHTNHVFTEIKINNFVFKISQSTQDKLFLVEEWEFLQHQVQGIVQILVFYNS